MDVRGGRQRGPEALQERIRELESQLASQDDLQGLVESLATHQEELRIQQVALSDSQRDLEASRDRYAELYDFAPIPILTLGHSGVLEAMNLTAARLLGVDRAIALGMPLLVYVHGSSRRQFLDHMARCRREDGIVRSEIVVRGLGGVDVPVEIQGRRYELRGSDKVVYQTVLIDQSERRRGEEERKRHLDERERTHREEVSVRAASEAKDRFLAVLSHELRTPLTPILLTLETLDGRDEAPPSLRRGLAMIRRNAETLTRLIDDLLDVTRIVHDKLHLVRLPISLHAVLRSVVEMCEADLEQVDIQLDFELDEFEPFVSGDALRLRQVFWNLLRNAIQHSPPHGRIALRSEVQGRRSVRVSVSDAGPGIEPEDLERVFEPFQQSQKSNRTGGGLGLGLAICRGLVEAHDGTIQALGHGVDKGATFVVELPTCAEPAAEILVPEAPSLVPRQRLRVLVVEDHEDTADAMRIVLTRLGYDVRVASSLRDARTQADLPFDVLVSDLQLPDGSGLDLMRGLSLKRPIRGIAMSGYGTQKDVERSRQAGFLRHLVKPVDINRVVEAIEAIARGSAS